MNITGSLTPVSTDHHLWESILEMDQKYFSRPWNRPAWEDLDWSNHLLKAWAVEETAVGFALFAHLPQDDVAHLLKIFMIPEYRGKGVTVLFWRELAFALEERGAKQVYLEVEASNKRAIGFYEKIGFKKLRTARGYYSDGADAVMMQLTL